MKPPCVIEKAPEFADLCTYAVPSILGRLAKTAKLKAQPRKPDDDTDLILTDISNSVLDGDRRWAANVQMTAMHGAFWISRMRRPSCLQGCAIADLGTFPNKG
jgi:hypothetical protein